MKELVEEKKKVSEKSRAGELGGRNSWTHGRHESAVNSHSLLPLQIPGTGHLIG